MWGGAFLFGLSMSLTSCEDILGEWSRPTPNPVTPGGGGSSSGVASITFTVPNLRFGMNSATPITLTANISPSDATITWSSSDDAVATVDATGKVTPVAVGTATITAKAGDKTAECPVYVYAGKASINDGPVNVTSGEWYIEGDGTEVANTITIANGASAILDGININNSTAGTTPSIICQGDATIILADGSTNTVTAPSGKAGIQIGGTGTLTINGETAGDGKLTVQGGSDAAGIGTNQNSTGGNIVINGGRVTAKGGNNGAGIGTGGATDDNNKCGAITINGGTVTATGGDNGAGIGTGGTYAQTRYTTAECGNIIINGGTVIATGGSDAAGIGTGVSMAYAGEAASQTCGAITIGNGVKSVTATKGTGSPNSIGVGDKDNSGGTENQACGTISIADPSKVTEN